MECLQECHERVDVVRVEHAADRQGAKCRVIDLDGNRDIAVELVRHLPEWSLFKSYLALQPGQALLHIDGNRLSRHTAGVNVRLVSGIDAQCTLRKSGFARGWRTSGDDCHGSLDDGHDRRVATSVAIKASSHGQDMYIARRDPEAAVFVMRDRKERLASRNLDQPLAAVVTDRNG